MAAIIAGPLNVAVPVLEPRLNRLKNGRWRERRKHLELSHRIKQGGQLGSCVQVPGRYFPSCSGVRCSLGSRGYLFHNGGGNNDYSVSDNLDALHKIDGRRFSNCDSNTNCSKPARGTVFRVMHKQSDLTKQTKTVGMLLGGILLALGFGALRFCKPAYAENLEPPPTLSSALEKESITSETEEKQRVNDVVNPEDQFAGGNEKRVDEGEFEPPFGEGSDLTTDPAEVLLRSYLQLNPDDLKALQALLFLRLKKGQVNAAGPVVKKLIELEPDNLEWKYIRAQADDFAGDLVQARQGFEELLQVRPLSARAWQGLAIVLLKTGEDEEALKKLNEAVQTATDTGQSKESLDLKILLGQLYTMQGDLEKAMELFKLVVDEDPQDYRPYLCQGLVFSIVGEPAEAEKYFRKYRKLCPKDLQQRGFLDDLLLMAKKESKELSNRAKAEEELKKKGKKIPKPMQQPIVSNGTPRNNQDAR